MSPRLREECIIDRSARKTEALGHSKCCLKDIDTLLLKLTWSVVTRGCQASRGERSNELPCKAVSAVCGVETTTTAHSASGEVNITRLSSSSIRRCLLSDSIFLQVVLVM